MTSPPKTIPFERYLAIDAHKRYVMVGGLNTQQEPVLLDRKIDVDDYPQWAQANLKPGDAVVIEATTNTWNLLGSVHHLFDAAAWFWRDQYHDCVVCDGDITRFPNAKKLVGYAGLGNSIHDSGQTHHSGHITKQGRRELRWALVEAAWIAVGSHPHWKEQFQKLTRRMKSSKAIVAIARKLLVVIWHMMTERVADRKADPEYGCFQTHDLVLEAQRFRTGWADGSPVRPLRLDATQTRGRPDPWKARWSETHCFYRKSPHGAT